MRYRNWLFITAIASSAIIALVLTTRDFFNVEIEPSKSLVSDVDGAIAEEIEKPDHSVAPRQARIQVSKRKPSMHPRRSGSTIVQEDTPRISLRTDDFDNPESELGMSQSNYDGNVVEYGDPLDPDSISEDITSSFEVVEIGLPLDPDLEFGLEESDDIVPRYIGEPMDADSAELNKSIDRENDYEINIGEFIDLDTSN